MQQVLVLNASYEPLNVCTVRRAHVLLYKGKAEVIEQLDQPLRSATGSFVWPHVIRLVHYVRVPRAIQGRDYARIYVKELDQGRPSVALSPEEQEAVERAMAR